MGWCGWRRSGSLFLAGYCEGTSAAQALPPKYCTCAAYRFFRPWARTVYSGDLPPNAQCMARLTRAVLMNASQSSPQPGWHHASSLRDQAGRDASISERSVPFCSRPWYCFGLVVELCSSFETHAARALRTKLTRVVRQSSFA